MKRGRVLVVDDKDGFLALFRRIAPSDVEIVCESDGLRALEMLESEHFDVVVSDVRMPGLDGLSLLQRIRDVGMDVEVVLMTAYGTIADAVRAMKLGAVDFVTKPFDPDDAVAAIDQALARRRARATAQARAQNTVADLDGRSHGGAHVADSEGCHVDSSHEDHESTHPLPYREAIAAERDRATREYLIRLLRGVHGNVTQAAEQAGIERESFHRLMKRHGVRAEDYRGK